MKIVLAAAAVLVTLLAIPSCGKNLTRSLAPNQPPEVRLERVDASSAGGASTFSLRWSGFDPDGRIDHYIYAVDPASVDRVDATWVRTTESALELRFRAPRTQGSAATREPHVFAIRAVDEDGWMSEVATAAAVEGNQPPTVAITSPPPSSQYVPLLPTTVRIRWIGQDPDPVLTPKPVKYKWTVLSPGSAFPIDQAIQNPELLRQYYAPGFAGWDSTGKDSTAITLTNLPIGVRFLFVVVAFDELGDYSPVFSLNTNMLQFRVGDPATLGPLLFLGGQPVGQGLAIPPLRIEVPSERRLSFGWSAQPPPGADLVGFRWVIDPVDVSDTTPRTDPSDVHHWTAVSLTTTAVSVGPFTGPRVVRLYIDALDTFGSVSRFLVELTVVAPYPFPLEDLLIVDDTRFRGDLLDPANGCVHPPLGNWPTAAELDTFLYARGGSAWRCYPAGSLTSPGLFAGYAFDTIGTRGRSSIPLLMLSQYRHVIWLVDAVGSTYSGDPFGSIEPTTLLRWMTTQGPNTLAQYASSGGKVWLAGGGAAYADLISRNRPTNDQPTTTFSSVLQELVPGTTMYDLAGWRSELRVTTVPARISRYGGRSRGSPVLAGLPEALELKTSASDPLPPLRTASAFYRTVASVEFLQQPNVVVEGGVSTLDTLFKATGAGLPAEIGTDDDVSHHRNVVMTHYHGPNVPQGLLFSGFDLWTFKRSQGQQLVDWVLRNQWGLRRNTAALTGGHAPPRPGSGGPVSRIGD